MAALGNFGSSTKLNFTVMGDCVNQASRIEGLTRHYLADVLVGDEAWEAVCDDERAEFVSREIGSVVVKGKANVTDIFEIADFAQPVVTMIRHDPENLAALREGIDEDARVTKLHVASNVVGQKSPCSGAPMPEAVAIHVPALDAAADGSPLCPLSDEPPPANKTASFVVKSGRAGASARRASAYSSLCSGRAQDSRVTLPHAEVVALFHAYGEALKLYKAADFAAALDALESPALVHDGPAAQLRRGVLAGQRAVANGAPFCAVHVLKTK